MAPVGAVADLICDEMHDNTKTKKFRLLQYISLGFQQMHLFLNPDVCIKTVVISPGQIKELPCDFMYETKVGLRDPVTKRICTIRQNNKRARSFTRKNDTESSGEVCSILGGLDVEDQCYFYNLFELGSYYGSVLAYGVGYDNNKYYDIQNNQIHISSCMPDDAEIIVEYKSDGLSNGLVLIPSEAFLALYYFGWARYLKEGPNGSNQVMYESEYARLKRLYSHKSVDTLSDIMTY